MHSPESRQLCPATWGVVYTVKSTGSQAVSIFSLRDTVPGFSSTSPFLSSLPPFVPFMVQLYTEGQEEERRTWSCHQAGEAVSSGVCSGWIVTRLCLGRPVAEKSVSTQEEMHGGKFWNLKLDSHLVCFVLL